MTFSDAFTTIGVVVTLASTGVTIHQARKARTYSRSAEHARDAAQLNAVAERLKSAQDHIRDIAPEKLGRRGYDAGKRIDSIRREFDATLGALPRGGTAKQARNLLSLAQSHLNTYQSSVDHQPDKGAWEKLQVTLQDTISDLSSRSIDKSDGYGK